MNQHYEFKEQRNSRMPVKNFRAGALQVAIWDNEAKDSDGSSRTFQTVSFERGYKDKNGQWQNTSHLRVNDLPKATMLLQKAYEYLVLTGDSND